jgi:SAM-dependent methyltransferase
MNIESEVSIEAVEEFWDNQPCNIFHSNKELGSVEYFNEVERRKYFVEPHIPQFAQFDNWENKDVLEIGCGIGTDGVNFARSGARYVGVELSGESLKIAKMRFKVFGLNGELFKANVENLTKLIERKMRFDLVYSFGVLHHTPNIGLALSNIRSLCHSESTFRFMVYARNSWKSAMINAGLDQPEAQHGCPIANLYTHDEIDSILNRTGFKLRKIEQAHIFPYDIKNYRNYRYVKLPWFESMPSEVFSALEDKFGWHLLIDAKPI